MLFSEGYIGMHIVDDFLLDCQHSCKLGGKVLEVQMPMYASDNVSTQTHSRWCAFGLP